VAVEKVVFEVPKMYADHHVEVVRDAVRKLDGVDAVVASSAFKRVVVRYDPQRLSKDAIANALSSAGYAPGEEPTLPKILESKEDSSSWFQMIQRTTSTNIKDLEMSGDFRKY